MANDGDRAERDADAAASGQGLAVVKTSGMPEILVEVLPGQMVSHAGRSYYGAGYSFAPDSQDENDTTVLLDGPTAVSLIQGGHVRRVEG